MNDYVVFPQCDATFCSAVSSFGFQGYFITVVMEALFFGVK